MNETDQSRVSLPTESARPKATFREIMRTKISRRGLFAIGAEAAWAASTWAVVSSWGQIQHTLTLDMKLEDAAHAEENFAVASQYSDRWSPGDRSARLRQMHKYANSLFDARYLSYLTSITEVGLSLVFVAIAKRMERQAEQR